MRRPTCARGGFERLVRHQPAGTPTMRWNSATEPPWRRSIPPRTRSPWTRARTALPEGPNRRRRTQPAARCPAGLPGIRYLRTVASATRSTEARPKAGGRRGHGFHRLRVAASLTQLGVQVSAVFPGRAPLERVLGDQMAALIGASHRADGVELQPNQVAAFAGAERVEAVVTASGNRLGVRFRRGGDRHRTRHPRRRGRAGQRGPDRRLCRTSAPDVYAAGDVADHLHPLFGGSRSTLRRRGEAGAAVARSMLGSTAPYDYLYTFWSDQYEHKLSRRSRDKWDSSWSAAAWKRRS